MGFSQDDNIHELTKREISNIKLNELQNQNYYKEIIDFEQPTASKADNWLKKISRIVYSIFSSKFSSLFFRILPYVIVIFAFVLIVLKLANIEFNSIFHRNSKSTMPVYFSNDIQDIKNLPIEKLLLEAEKNLDYKLMIRYTYLLILRNLHNKELIQWEIHKSNYDYLYETKALDIALDFKRLTINYEFVWYGDFNLEQKLGESIFHEMKSFNNDFNQKNS